MTYTATYSPDDNKLRLYASTRLDAETYARVKAAGFKWAPKQELFVAPAWTPDREDLLLELAGEIDDEDRSLVDRAEERAERFDGYSERRGEEAERARKAVDTIAQRFDGGQPILVGHHSERRARKDAERIESGMRNALRLWDTARYWTDRAAGAIGHAKYKERPDVRARRIKTIEADQRKMQRTRAQIVTKLDAWEVAKTTEQARALAGFYHLNFNVAPREDQPQWPWTASHVLQPDGERRAECPAMTVDQVRDILRERTPRALARADRWLAHYDNRLAYERAMLAEAGFVEPPKRASRAVLPLLNYDGEVRVRNRWNPDIDTFTAHPMTKAEYAAIGKDYTGTAISEDGTHRLRMAILHNPTRRVAVFLTDAKAHPRPGTGEAAAEVDARVQAGQDRIQRAAKARADVQASNAEAVRRATGPKPEPAPAADESAVEAFERLRKAAKVGVQVVSASQLFPTPASLADEVVAYADIEPGMRVLEPSAGMGALLDAIDRAVDGVHAVAVEINATLANRIDATRRAVVHGDFLACDAESFAALVPDGQFDRIVMNPPFGNGADIRHILHAMNFLAPGGRLVSLCATGPRQTRILRPLTESHGGQWVELPPGAFAESGTMVRAALLVLNKPALRAAA